jgi:hypothetical protein
MGDLSMKHTKKITEIKRNLQKRTYPTVQTMTKVYAQSERKDLLMLQEQRTKRIRELLRLKQTEKTKKEIQALKNTIKAGNRLLKTRHYSSYIGHDKKVKK